MMKSLTRILVVLVLAGACTEDVCAQPPEPKFVQPDLPAGDRSPQLLDPKAIKAVEATDAKWLEKRDDLVKLKSRQTFERAGATCLESIYENWDQEKQEWIEMGAIYYHPRYGAHALLGDVWARWKDLGGRYSTIGLPVSDERQKSGPGVSERWVEFEGGMISSKHYTSERMSYFFQNMALLDDPIPFHDPYKGQDRDSAIETLIELLKNTRPSELHLTEDWESPPTWPPEVVGLCEVFDQDEREYIKQELDGIYPHSIEGPREIHLALPNYPGGLLLLSQHPIDRNESGQTIYRHCGGEDCAADKGVLHARIRKSQAVRDGHWEYDVFLSHTQNPGHTEVGGVLEDVGLEDDFRVKTRKALQWQFRQAAAFIQGQRSPGRRPAILMGDLNWGPSITRNDQTGDFDIDDAHYSTMMSLLEKSEDLWTVAGPKGITDEVKRAQAGITSDKVSAFKSDRDPLPLDDATRSKAGSRIDHFLSWPGEALWPDYRNMRVIKHALKDEPERDMSDHYGIYVEQVGLRELLTTYWLERYEIGGVKAGLHRVRCLEETKDLGDRSSGAADDIQVKVGLGTERSVPPWVMEVEDPRLQLALLRHFNPETPWDKETGWSDEKEFEAGNERFYEGDPDPVEIDDPGFHLYVYARAEEVDLVSNDDLGPARMTLERADLLRALNGTRIVRTMPLVRGVRGEGGVYAVDVWLRVRPPWRVCVKLINRKSEPVVIHLTSPDNSRVQGRGVIATLPAGKSAIFSVANESQDKLLLHLDEMRVSRRGHAHASGQPFAVLAPNPTFEVLHRHAYNIIPSGELGGSAISEAAEWGWGKCRVPDKREPPTPLKASNLEHADPDAPIWERHWGPGTPNPEDKYGER